MVSMLGTKGPLSGQKGQALISVMFIMVLGSLLLVPVLNYATTIIRTVNANEARLDGFYAADSGVEYGLYKLRAGLFVPPAGVTLSLPQQVNGLDVSINIVIGTTTITTGDTSDYDIYATTSRNGSTVTRVMAATMRDGSSAPYIVWIEVWDVLESH
ncbi:MAG: hypothetical protein HY670_10355 [Chloroflexi bacterium]|nr:hypothetical protein [Chloroflexota bacterium]